MTLTWYPDFCPSGQCQIEIEQDWSAPKAFVHACPHHQGLRGQHGDGGAFQAILKSSQLKEIARWAAKEELMERGLMDKDHPGVPYRVESNGDFVIEHGQIGAVKAAIESRAAVAMARIGNRPGRSGVRFND